MQLKNRRNFRRIISQFPVTYKIPGKKESTGKCCDLSAGGIKLEIQENIPVGTPLEITLKISLPQSEKKYCCAGTVVWSHAKKSHEIIFVAGIAFNELFLDISDLM